MSSRTLLLAAAAVGALWLTTAVGQGAGQKFYPDDPIARDRDDVADASKAVSRELSENYDFLSNTFGSPGEDGDIAAVNANTIGEVPDSSWFTNRIGVRTPAPGDDEIARGPDTVTRPFSDRWTITRGKGPGGFQPGFRAVNEGDPSGQVYQIEFDPPSHPELATGAEIIGTAVYHALGYNVAEMYLVTVDPAKLEIAGDADVKDTNGRRKFTKRDADAVFALAARLPDGRYRGLASRLLEGRGMGPFEYHGTRGDDPNDIHPHEHRRELRGNRVFAAWLNHDDSRAINSLDMLVPHDGREVFRHYMYDFGAILGSATRFPDPPENGHEYYVDKRPSLLTLATLGLYLKPWIRRSQPDDIPRSAGSFTHVGFDPVTWKANYPNPAFLRMRGDDAFWAARRVAAFTDQQIRAIVAKARYSDPAAAAHVADTLIKRRDIVARTWLAGVNPVVDPALSRDGALTFRNAALDAAAGVAPPSSYSFRWSRFDNVAQSHTAVGGAIESTEPGTSAPPALLDGSDFISVAIAASSPQHPAWTKPLQVYFRRSAAGWQTVGIENR